MERHRRHLHARPPRQVVARVEQRHPAGLRQVPRPPHERVPQRLVRLRLQPGDRRAGVHDDAAGPANVHRERGRRDRQHLASDADAGHADVVESVEPAVLQQRSDHHR